MGGTGGIGRATARRFLQEGARVVVSGLSSAETHEALEALRPVGPVWSMPADVSDAGSVERLFQATLPLLGGRLDVLVHVAGVSGRRAGDGPLHECAPDGWEFVFAINARGPFLTNQTAVRRMLAQTPDTDGLRGTVLNVGSVLDRAPSPEFFGTVAYAASKGAVRALTRASAACYARRGIRFNLLVPALIETPMATRAVGDPAIRAYIAAKQPMTAGPGAPADCAEAALYLCEPASRFVTGAELIVDGGWCLAEGPGAFASAVLSADASNPPTNSPESGSEVQNRATLETTAPGSNHWPWPDFETWTDNTPPES